MSLPLNDIIGEAGVLVPNDVNIIDQVVFLNSLNQDFFNVVKIPKIVTFEPIMDKESYQINNQVRQKNIDLVMCGVVKYSELNPDVPNPLQNTYSFDDETYVLSLYPSPYQNGLRGTIRYSRLSTTTFTSSNLTSTPDAPEEYHYSFVLGLASFLANTQDDMIKASNYENQYKSMWNVAAQNYAKEVTA